jgi:hypothetical protein
VMERSVPVIITLALDIPRKRKEEGKPPNLVDPARASAANHRLQLSIRKPQP